MTRTLRFELNDPIARKIETMPINAVNRDQAQAHLAAVEESVDRIGHAVAWLRTLVASAGPSTTPRRPSAVLRHTA